jgi:hypothetical protein
MANQRTNILLDELTQLYQEIADFKVENTDQVSQILQSQGFSQRVSEFVHFILSTPELKPEFSKLITWYECQLDSSKVAKLITEAKKVAISLGIVCCSSRLNNGGNTQQLHEKRWKNPFDIHSGSLSAAEFFELLQRDNDYKTNCIQKISDILQIIRGDDVPENGIFPILDLSIQNQLNPLLSNIEEILNSLKILLEFELRYAGHEEAKELLRLYLRIHPDKRLIEQFAIKYNVAKALVMFEPNKGSLSNPEIGRLKEASKRVLKVLSRSLIANQTRSFTVYRLKAYMEWFYNSKRIKRKTWHENQLTEEMAKFLFAQGFFPFIRFKVGLGEPDMVALSEHEEIIIEAKNYLERDKPTKNRLKRKKLTSKKINYHVSQAIQYYDKMRSLKKEMDNQVYLMIFYNGDFYPVCAESIFKNGVFVNIVFVYLGSKTPHEKRKDLILAIDNTTEENS